MNHLAYFPVLFFVFTKGNEGSVESTLSKSYLQRFEFVLILINSELLYLRRCIQRLNYLFDFAAGQRICIAREEVDPNKRFRPAWDILQFGSTLDSL